MREKIGLMHILLLLFLSAGIIFFNSNLIPKNLAYDEVEFARLALSLENKPYSPYSSLATGHSTLYFYIILLSLKIFGVTKFALRLPSALSAIGCVMVLYLIMKMIIKQYNNIAIGQSNTSYLVILSAIILLTSRWFLTFSRFGFEATFLLFLELSSIYFLLNIFRKNVSRSTSSVSSILSGLFAGLAFNSYTPGRIFFLLPLGVLIYKIKKQYNNITIKQLLFFVFPFLITITPLAIYLVIHPDPRIESQFFLSNEMLTPTTKLTYLWQNFKSTVLMFFIEGDMNGRHNFPGKPALNPILATLLIMGFAVSLKKWKNAINLLAISYWLLAILPAVLTYPWENPNMLRAFTVLPAVVYLIILATYNLITVINKALKIKINYVLAVFSLLFFISSFYELRTYFKYQSRVFNNAFEIKCDLKQALQYDNKLIFKYCGVTKNEF